MDTTPMIKGIGLRVTSKGGEIKVLAVITFPPCKGTSRYMFLM